jgi:AcrR family transcriptional regulator
VTIDKGEHSTRTIRRPRTDAVRNRERVLEAAKAVFSAGGPEASLEAVAQHARVGIGTLYRHFPTREVLFEAVYRREVEQLADLAAVLILARSQDWGFQICPTDGSRPVGPTPLSPKCNSVR